MVHYNFPKWPHTLMKEMEPRVCFVTSLQAREDPGNEVVFAAPHLYFLKYSDCSQDNLITVRACTNIQS